MIKKGSRVKVKDSGKQYPTYFPMFDEMGIKHNHTAIYLNREFSLADLETELFTVFDIKKHHSMDSLLIGIQSRSGSRYLIGKRGLSELSKSVDVFDNVRYSDPNAGEENWIFKVKKVYLETQECIIELQDDRWINKPLQRVYVSQLVNC